MGHRPVLVVQADAFNRSRIGTVIATVVTSNVRLAGAPGNVLIRTQESGLGRDGVVNVSQLITLDRRDLAAAAEPGDAPRSSCPRGRGPGLLGPAPFVDVAAVSP